jgi:hypothetical protein
MPKNIAKLVNPNTKRAKNLRKPWSATAGAPRERSLLLGVEATGPRRRGDKPRGRKPDAATKIRKTPPGRAAVRLRSSINSLVSQESDSIAKALVDKTVAGNMTGARLIVALAGADKPPIPLKKKRSRKSLLDLLESEPQWNPSMGSDASCLPPSEPDDPV